MSLKFHRKHFENGERYDDGVYRSCIRGSRSTKVKKIMVPITSDWFFGTINIDPAFMHSATP